MNTNINNEFKSKLLIIPDYVLPNDIPTIYNYFEYYNIAELKSVQVFNHPEPEYNCEDKPYYCYAVIEVEKWIDNNGSNNSSTKLLKKIKLKNKLKVFLDNDNAYFERLN